MIKSISTKEQEIIQWILDLHCSSQIEVDATYSKGNFYKKGIKPPILKFDINPQTSDVLQGDCRNLVLTSDTYSTIMFDPPFLATTGPSLRSTDKNNIMTKRFGMYNNEKELHQFYIDSLKEQYRILKENGILIFKCQDKVSSGKQYLSHVFIINEANKIGFYCKDLFILEAKNRIIANWQRNQKHARKFHSYFLVFQKTNKKIDYT